MCVAGFTLKLSSDFGNDSLAARHHAEVGHYAGSGAAHCNHFRPGVVQMQNDIRTVGRAVRRNSLADISVLQKISFVHERRGRVQQIAVWVTGDGRHHLLLSLESGPVCRENEELPKAH